MVQLGTSVITLGLFILFHYLSLNSTFEVFLLHPFILPFQPIVTFNTSPSPCLSSYALTNVILFHSLCLSLFGSIPFTTPQMNTLLNPHKEESPLSVPAYGPLGHHTREEPHSTPTLSGPTSTSQSADDDEGLRGTGWGDGGPVYLET